MEITRCLKLLELESPATMAEVRRAYRDLVRVWHPDRFPGDPGLRRRAEERVKQLNIAYSTLVRHLERRGDNAFVSQKNHNAAGKEEARSVEAAFEAGTFKFLKLCHSLSRVAQSVLKEAKRAKKLHS